MAPMFNNEARNERTQFKEGGSKGKQGAYGTGKEKVSGEGDSGGDTNYKSATDFLGAPCEDQDVSGVNVVKGSSAPGYEGPKKGKAGDPMGGAGGLKKPKTAEEAGR